MAVTFQGFMPNKKRPEIAVYKDEPMDLYKIRIQGDNFKEVGSITRQECKELIHDLRIHDMNDFISRFNEVCDYFILKNQYVRFEETKR